MPSRRRHRGVAGCWRTARAAYGIPSRRGSPRRLSRPWCLWRCLRDWQLRCSLCCRLPPGSSGADGEDGRCANDITWPFHCPSLVLHVCSWVPISPCDGALLSCRMRLSSKNHLKPQRNGSHSKRLAFRMRWWTAQTDEKPSDPPPMQRSLRCAGLLPQPHSLCPPPCRIRNTRQVSGTICAQDVAAVQDYRWMFAQSPDSLDESGAVYPCRSGLHMKAPCSCRPSEQGSSSIAWLERCRVPSW